MNKKRMVLIFYVILLTVCFAGISSVLYANSLGNKPQDLNGVMFDKDSLNGDNIENISLSDGGRSVKFTLSDDSSNSTFMYKVKNDSKKNVRLGTPAINCYADDLNFTDDGKLSNVLISNGDITHDFGTINISRNNTFKNINVECVLNVSSEEAVMPVVILEKMNEVGKGSVGIFSINATSDTFLSIEIDDNLVDSKNYTVSSDNAKVSLTSEYTETLELGNHTILINSTLGSASTSFEIVNPLSFTINGTLYKTSPGSTFEKWIMETGGDETGNNVLWVSPKNANSDLNSSIFSAGGKWEAYKNDSNKRLYIKGDEELSQEALCLNNRDACDITIYSNIENDGIYAGYSTVK